MHRLRHAIVLILLAFSAFLIWSGVVVGLRAFEAHPDSQPQIYLGFGSAYIALAVVCRVGALLLLRWR